MTIKINEFLTGGLNKTAAKQEANSEFSNIFGALGSSSECHIAAFTAAMDEYMDSVLTGQGEITEEALDARLEEFTVKFAPDEPATEQEFAVFAEKFAEFTFRLYEMLEGDKEAAANFMRAKLPGNPNLQQQLLNPNEGGAK